MRTWLGLPDVHPAGTMLNVLLAWIAYKSHENTKSEGKAEQEASHLFVQQLLRQGSASSAARVLKALTQQVGERGPWMEVSRPSKGLSGHYYTLGPAARGDAEHWIAVGRQLFGASGVLKPYLVRPVFQASPYGHGPNGCLCLAFIERFGPVRMAEVVRAMNGFMVADTARNKVSRLTSVGLVLEDDGQYETPRNLLRRIEQDEAAFGARKRAAAVDAEIGSKQYAYQLSIRGGPTLSRVKSMLRKLPCFYCREIPAAEGGAVEHFPPIHWGGSDDYSVLLPICTTCNTSHGAILRRTPKEPPPMSPVFTSMQSGLSAEDTAKWFYELMIMNAAGYADALNDGRVEDARGLALSLFPTWMALKSGVDVLDTTTGEISRITVPHDIDLVAEMGRNFGGIPKLLGGTRKARRESP